MLYRELLASCKSRLDAFFKKVRLFKNTFTYEEINEQCYSLMYINNNKDNIKKVCELKKQIPALKNLCKECAPYFMNPRNKSIPKYDVLKAQEFEESFMDFLRTKFKTEKIERGDLEDRRLPDIKISKENGEVVAYCELKFHEAPFILIYQEFINHYCYEYSATLDYEKISEQISLIKSKGINEPVYYVHWIEYPCLKGVFYEPMEQVEKHISEQENIFKREMREGDKQKTAKATYLDKIYSPLLELKDFDSLMDKLSSLLRK